MEFKMSALLIKNNCSSTLNVVIAALILACLVSILSPVSADNESDAASKNLIERSLLAKDANAVGSVGSTDIGKERLQGSQTETSSGMKPKRKKKKKIKNATNTAKAVNEGAGKVILQRFKYTQNQLVIEALQKNGTIATKEAPTAVVDPEAKPVPPRAAVDPESKQVYKLKSLKEDQDQSSIGENDKKKSDETAESNEKKLKKNIRNKEPGSEPGVVRPKKTISGDDIPSSIGFMTYFIFCIVILVSIYIAVHNRKKIMAYLIEGRKGKSSSRRQTSSSQTASSSSEYRPLTSSEDLPPTSSKFVA